MFASYGISIQCSLIDYLYNCNGHTCIDIANCTQRNGPEIKDLQCYKRETTAWLSNIGPVAAELRIYV